LEVRFAVRLLYNQANSNNFLLHEPILLITTDKDNMAGDVPQNKSKTIQDN
jgi:hypothetical protein